MKLYKVLFETEIMILAEDESEAINEAEYKVNEETHIYTYSEEIETKGQLGNWKGCLPYSAKRCYATNSTGLIGYP